MGFTSPSSQIAQQSLPLGVERLGVTLIVPFCVQFKSMWSSGSLPTLCHRDVVIIEVEGEKYNLRLNIYLVYTVFSHMCIAY